MYKESIKNLSLNHLEIEKKFLLKNLPSLSNGIKIIQAYLFVEDDKEMRVRIKENACKIAIKFNLQTSLREEYEYIISLEEGLRLIELGSAYPPIEKTRYKIICEDLLWEVDVFENQNKGLILAEVELTHPEQDFKLPEWVGEEVTADQRYLNSYLYKYPYINW